MAADGSSIRSVRQLTKDGSSVESSFFCQLEDLQKKETTGGKPYWELRLRDATDNLTLRAWSDSPAFAQCESLQPGSGVALQGEFYLNGPYGLDCRRWKLRELTAEESSQLFQGDPETAEKVQRDFAWIQECSRAIQDPRLQALTALFWEKFGTRFERAAAARQNHHAWRGGLLCHTAQMLRTADAIVSVYPHLNGDLLAAGVIFHDCGKLWETCPPEQGFDIVRDLRGELLGHISIGIELVNSLWRELDLESWKDLQPTNEQVRLHLLHLIASHHGQMEFGSPVLPRTPEAMALHHIDNLDAKLEMLKDGYATQPEIAPGIYERLRPLGVSPVAPLAQA